MLKALGTSENKKAVEILAMFISKGKQGWVWEDAFHAIAKNAFGIENVRQDAIDRAARTIRGYYNNRGTDDEWKAKFTEHELNHVVSLIHFQIGFTYAYVPEPKKEDKKAAKAEAQNSKPVPPPPPAPPAPVNATKPELAKK